jgi:sugar phosphate permease
LRFLALAGTAVLWASAFPAIRVAVDGVGVAALSFVRPAVSTAARWFAGRIGDRRGEARLVLPALLASATGVLAMALTGSAVAVLGGVALFGAGFGVAQNATLSLMYARVPVSGYGTVSALWNLAYDGGMGIGAVGHGAAAARTCYPAAFALTAAVMLGRCSRPSGTAGPVVPGGAAPVLDRRCGC